MTLMSVREPCLSGYDSYFPVVSCFLVFSPPLVCQCLCLCEPAHNYRPCHDQWFSWEQTPFLTWQSTISDILVRDSAWNTGMNWFGVRFWFRLYNKERSQFNALTSIAAKTKTVRNFLSLSTSLIIHTHLQSNLIFLITSLQIVLPVTGGSNSWAVQYISLYFQVCLYFLQCQDKGNSYQTWLLLIDSF